MLIISLLEFSTVSMWDALKVSSSRFKVKQHTIVYFLYVSSYLAFHLSFSKFTFCTIYNTTWQMQLSNSSKLPGFIQEFLQSIFPNISNMCLFHTGWLSKPCYAIAPWKPKKLLLLMCQPSVKILAPHSKTCKVTQHS